jgi:hypothetical protein
MKLGLFQRRKPMEEIESISTKKQYGKIQRGKTPPPEYPVIAVQIKKPGTPFVLPANQVFAGKSEQELRQALKEDYPGTDWKVLSSDTIQEIEH